jgi:hypothetical protein
MNEEQKININEGEFILPDDHLTLKKEKSKEKSCKVNKKYKKGKSKVVPCRDSIEDNKYGSPNMKRILN